MQKYNLIHHFCITFIQPVRQFDSNIYFVYVNKAAVEKNGCLMNSLIKEHILKYRYNNL